MNNRTPMSDDAARGGVMVVILLVLAVANGMWLVAVPCVVLVALIVLALL